MRSNPQPPIGDLEDRDRVEPDPEERTQVVRRTSVEPVPLVDDMPSRRTEVAVQERPTSVAVVRKAQQVLWYAVGVLETLMALRVLLLAVGANRANPFFSALLNVTDFFTAPFANLVTTPRFGDAVLELGSIFAMVLYLLIAYAISRLLELALPDRHIEARSVRYDR